MQLCMVTIASFCSQTETPPPACYQIDFDTVSLKLNIDKQMRMKKTLSRQLNYYLSIITPALPRAVLGPSTTAELQGKPSMEIPASLRIPSRKRLACNDAKCNGKMQAK